ncbi:O-antigen ligase family protein [Vibrio owensii]|uniref:O-antigen ligase n=1 Tax=Vibrio owensii CAIM 1854 = LMG 25443 TaxID=1229493 RepID=A0A0C1VS79_9VIBR|nr:O-antigen ligase family protein [Vibrio owensii]KIF46852.1 O-antigen ligase [Vibrio owensii CAIM 1854 = LMG 25443]
MNYLFRLLMILPLMWSFSGMLIYPDAKKTQVILVVLAILSSFFCHDKKVIFDNIKGNNLVRFLFFLVVISLFLKLLHGYSSSVIRTLSCFLLYFAFVPKNVFRAFKRKLPFLLLVSSVFSFGYAFWSTYILDLGRWWSINPIPYSSVSVGACVGSLFFLLSRSGRSIQLLMIVTFALSLNVIIFSESRGTALAVFSVSVLIILFFMHLKIDIIRKVVIIFLILVSSLIVNANLIQNRMDRTSNEIAQIESGNMNSSIGLRLQIWKAGIYLIKDKLLVGYGDNHRKAKETLLDQGVITQDVVKFTHYHNELINAWVLNGLVGVIMILSMLFVPFYLCKKIIYRYARSEKLGFSKSSVHNLYVQQSIVGVFITLGYAVAGLTDVPFQFSITISFYMSSLFVILLGYEDLVIKHKSRSTILDLR